MENKDLEFEKWQGIDFSLQESLMKYNLLIRKRIQKTPEKHDYQYIVKIGSNLHNSKSQDFHFHVGGVDESYIDEKIKDLCSDSFYDFIDCNDFGFLESTFEIKVYDLLCYFEYEDIFGCDYGNEPYTLEQLLTRFPELKNQITCTTSF